MPRAGARHARSRRAGVCGRLSISPNLVITMAITWNAGTNILLTQSLRKELPKASGHSTRKLTAHSIGAAERSERSELCAVGKDNVYRSSSFLGIMGLGGLSFRFRLQLGSTDKRRVHLGQLKHAATPSSSRMPGIPVKPEVAPATVVACVHGRSLLGSKTKAAQMGVVFRVNESAAPRYEQAYKYERSRSSSNAPDCDWPDTRLDTD
jgi:hypothetical protein